MEPDFEIPESVTNVTLSKANWPFRRKDVTDCKHCSAMREAAAKVCDPGSATDDISDAYHRGWMAALKGARAYILTLPCQCPPIEGGLTRAQIKNWIEGIDNYGQDNGYWVPTKEAFREVCYLALRQCQCGSVDLSIIARQCQRFGMPGTEEEIERVIKPYLLAATRKDAE